MDTYNRGNSGLQLVGESNKVNLIEMLTFCRARV